MSRRIKLWVCWSWIVILRVHTCFQWRALTLLEIRELWANILENITYKEN
jgi:hypothetical protein